MKVIREAVGDKKKITGTAEDTRWIRRCPAVRLAVSRTPNASGRINRLIVSIRIRAGISGVGVPSGRKCARECVSWLRRPTRTVVNQRGIAKPRLMESCVVGVKVYGSRPSKFIVKRKASNEANRKAHLCAEVFRGRRSCFVNNVKNQFRKVWGRLSFH